MTVERLSVNYTPDSDTIRAFHTVGNATEEMQIRLAYIDAPKIGHATIRPYAISARAYLRRLLALGEAVRVTLLGQDQYGCLLGELRRVRDDGNCGLQLVLGGYCALHECPQNRSEYYAAQEIAQKKRLGIWHAPGLQQLLWLYRELQP